MTRVLLLTLVAALVGCSGAPIDTGPSPSQKARPGTSKDTPPGTPPAPKSSPKDTPSSPAARTPERLQELIAALRNPDEGVSASASMELRGWGKDAAPAAGPLAAVVAAGGKLSSSAALEALEAVWPDRAADLHALAVSTDTAKVVAAAKSLAGSPPEVSKTLLPIIDQRIAELPKVALQPHMDFARAGQELGALVPLLVKAGVDRAGFQAVVDCAKVSPEGGKPLWEPAQLALCAFVKDAALRKDALAALDSSLSSRPSAATLQSVGDLGPDAKPLAPLLGTLATDRDADVRKAAAEALKKVQG
jgi:hypothetical protein